MKRLFISQPMKDKTDAEIKGERDRILDKMKKELNDDVELINSFFEAAPHDDAISGIMCKLRHRIYG